MSGTAYGRHKKTSDVIKDFVFKDKAKAKDIKPENEDEDKDLEPRTRPRTSTWNQGQSQKNSKPKLKTSKCHYYNDTLPSTGVTLIKFGTS